MMALTPLSLRGHGLVQVESNLILFGLELEFTKGFLDDEGASVYTELSNLCLREIFAGECGT